MISRGTCGIVGIDGGLTTVPERAVELRNRHGTCEGSVGRPHMPKEQRCHLVSIWMTWALVPAIAGVVAWRSGWSMGFLVLAAGSLFQVMYVRWFPRLSVLLGYGSVADQTAEAVGMPAKLPQVTIYTASVCPFCPIVKRRVAELQQKYMFDVQEIDVTFRPEIIREKGIRSVPVIEVNGRTLVGNATTAQLADFLRAS